MSLRIPGDLSGSARLGRELYLGVFAGGIEYFIRSYGRGPR